MKELDNTLKKVLICAPQADVKNYCWDLWYENVKNLSYPNTELFLADNSLKNDNHKRLLSMGIKSEYIKHKGRGVIERMALSHEACRQYAIRHNFDYMFHLETDIICPSNTIQRLMMHKLLLVGGQYYIGFGKSRRLMIQTMQDTKLRFYNPTRYENEHFGDGTVKPVFHIGLGCMLIHKDLFKRFPFRWVKGSDTHPDTHFAMDVMESRIQNHVDTSILCEHHNTPWGEYGKDYF